MAQDALQVDAIDLAVPPYEEDVEELFSGPGFPGYSEFPDEEFYEDNDEDENYQAYPEVGVSSLEQSVAQRVGSREPPQTGILRDSTH